MNKKRVDKYLPLAIDAIEKCSISNEKGDVTKTFRGNISSFGAAVTMGSFKAAVAFFSQKNKSTIDRQNLIAAMWYVVKNGEKKDVADICKEILRMNGTELDAITAEFLDASIAIKLAMNVYNLK